MALGPGLGASILAGSARAAGPVERLFDLEINDGQVPRDKRVLRVKQDDTVRLRWTTDAPITLHLHGYDIEKKIVPGQVTEFAFKAYATGRFPVNVHGSGHGAGHQEAAIVTLEVYPR